jgi:hypothetical protein
MENFTTLKKLLLLILLIAASQQLQAQTDEQIRNKSKGYLEKQSAKQRIRRVPQTEIDKNVPDSNTLYIIDNKILAGTAEELKKIKLETLDLVRSIKDPAAASVIKYILIFRTKEN